MLNSSCEMHALSLPISLLFCCCIFTIVSTQTHDVSPDILCPDGEVPLNSLHQRCHSLTDASGPLALPWLGKKCDNSTRKCPSKFDCLSGGICCDTFKDPTEFVSNIYANMCPVLFMSSLKPMGTSCRNSTDCGLKTKVTCCENKCYHWPYACGLMRENYLRLYETGIFPGTHFPICDSYGNFHPIQHDERTGMFWCVDILSGQATNKNCCLPQPIKTSVCPEGQKIQECPREMCNMEVCISHPHAICRVNPCGDTCTVEFYENGKKVDCNAVTGLSKCKKEQQEYYKAISRMHRYDQTLPFQSWMFELIVDWNMSAVDTRAVVKPPKPQTLHCTLPRCVHYDPSQLEPPAAATASNSRRCPSGFDYANDASYGCRSSCSRHSECNTDSRTSCCFVGCSRECMKVDNNLLPSTVEFCSYATISSGHCPESGCHKMCKYWGYDVKRRTCRSFWFAGSGGNENKFNNFEECIHYTHACNRKVLFPVPLLPICAGSKYQVFQQSDHIYFSWCANPDSGIPTPGSLYSGNVLCLKDGRLSRRNYVNHKMTCLDGSDPLICQNMHTDDQTCQTPGVFTYLDGCNSCKKVHLNEDGAVVPCHSKADICSGKKPCQAINTRYYYNKTSNQCRSLPGGRHSCNETGSVNSHNSFTREDFCMHVCPTEKCAHGKDALGFYPNLCVQPSCNVSGASCVADECQGLERYFLHGKEIESCKKKFTAFNLNPLCSMTTTTVQTPVSTNRPTSSSVTATTTTALPLPTSTTSTTTTTTTVSPLPTSKASPSPSPSSAQSSSTTTPKVLEKVCLRFHRIGYSVECTPDGLFKVNQCNRTHCYCVVADSGVKIPSTVVERAAQSKLTCKHIETLEVEMTFKFEAAFSLVNGRISDFVKSISGQLAKFALIDSKFLKITSVRAGSVLLDVHFKKSTGDSADIAAAAEELKHVSLSGQLKVTYNGVDMVAYKNFTGFNRNDKFTNTAYKSHANEQASQTGAIAGGVFGSMVVIAIAVAVFLYIRKRREDGSHIMSDDGASMRSGSEISSFSNTLYGNTEHVYADIESTVSSSRA